MTAGPSSPTTAQVLAPSRPFVTTHRRSAAGARATVQLPSTRLYAGILGSRPPSPLRIGKSVAPAERI